MDDVDTVDDDTDDEGTNAMDDRTGSGYGSGRAAPPSTPPAARTPLRNGDLSSIKLAGVGVVTSAGGSHRTPGGSNAEAIEQTAMRSGPYKGTRVLYFARPGDPLDENDIRKKRKKAMSARSSAQHRSDAEEEAKKRASRESSKKHWEKKKRSDEEERKRNEEEAAREKAARAQADRQRETRLLAKFQYRAEFWLRQSRTGYSDSLFPVVMDDVEKSVAVPAADSTVALTDEEKHILERLKGSFLFQQPLYPIETVECRGLDDEQTDHSHRHPFMTSWTAVRGLNFDMLYFRWHFGNWRLTQP